MSKYDVESQALHAIPGRIQKLNINAVIVQIKPMGDAFYNSPTSRSASITGTREDPVDVLRFVIDEAHKRDGKFHAWMNPFRIARANSGNPYPNLLPSVQPEWVISHENSNL